MKMGKKMNWHFVWNSIMNKYGYVNMVCLQSTQGSTFFLLYYFQQIIVITFQIFSLELIIFLYRDIKWDLWLIFFFFGGGVVSGSWG